MALSLRAASGANLVAATPVSQTITLPTGTTTGDLTYFCISLANVVSAPVLSGGTGWTISLSTDATGTSSTIIGYKTIVVSEVAPTVSWTTAARVSWVAITLQPAAGFIAQHSGYATVLTGATATTHTPNSYAAGALSGASVLLAGPRVTANLNGVALTNTPPTNWTEPTNGDQSTASGNFRQISAWTGYRLAQTGTIAPGVLTHSAASNAIVHHAFAIEVVPPGLATRFSATSGSTAATVNTIATVPAGGVPAGTLMIASYNAYQFGGSAPTTTIADSKTNMWTNNVDLKSSNVGILEIWSTVLTTPLVAGDTVTVTSVEPGAVLHNDYALAVDFIAGYTNVGASAGTVTFLPTGSTTPSASLTPAAAASALVYGYLVTQTTAPTITEDADTAGGDTWHSQAKVTSSTAGRIVQLAGAFKVSTPAATAQTYNPTLGASQGWVSVVVAYPVAVPVILPQPVTNINQVSVQRASTY